MLASKENFTKEKSSYYKEIAWELKHTYRSDISECLWSTVAHGRGYIEVIFLSVSVHRHFTIIRVKVTRVELVVHKRNVTARLTAAHVLSMTDCHKS